MQPRLHIEVLPLETNRLIRQLSPNILLIRSFRCRLLRLLRLLPTPHVASVVCHPFGQVVGAPGLCQRVPELVGGKRICAF